MDALRKLHNSYKRHLIQKFIKKGDEVLDCGCGRGGDWHKWKDVGAVVYAIDPDGEALLEAEKRSKEIPFEVIFLGIGDVRLASSWGEFDAICYNFSIHYISPNLEDSVLAINRALRPGGLLFGIAPFKEYIDMYLGSNFKKKDKLGNEIEKKQNGNLCVNLVGGPFYASGGREEPILDFKELYYALEKYNIECLEYKPMLHVPNGLISEVYATFVFRKKTQDSSRRK